MSRAAPFLKRPETQEFIVDIATADPLVIYVGAGVTIDRTGQSWGQLIEGMLDVTADGSDEGLRRRIVSSLGPMQAASIAEQLYLGCFGPDKKDVRNRMTDRIRTL